MLCSWVHDYPCLVSNTYNTMSNLANEKSKGGFKLEFKHTHTHIGHAHMFVGRAEVYDPSLPFLNSANT